jgi:hypothetical protein
MELLQQALQFHRLTRQLFSAGSIRLGYLIDLLQALVDLADPLSLLVTGSRDLFDQITGFGDP